MAGIISAVLVDTDTESVADVSSPVSSPTVNSPHRVEATHSTCVVPETIGMAQSLGFTYTLRNENDC